MRVLAALLVLATAHSGAIAGDANAEREAKPKKVCKASQHTGSRMTKRVCKTVQEWRHEEERANGEDLVVKNDQYRVDQSANLGGPN